MKSMRESYFPKALADLKDKARLTAVINELKPDIESYQVLSQLFLSAGTIVRVDEIASEHKASILEGYKKINPEQWETFKRGTQFKYDPSISDDDFMLEDILNLRDNYKWSADMVALWGSYIELESQNHQDGIRQAQNQIAIALDKHISKKPPKISTLQHKIITAFDRLYWDYVAKIEKEIKDSQRSDSVSTVASQDHNVTDASQPWNKGHLGGGVTGVIVCGALTVLFPPAGIVMGFIYALGIIAITTMASWVGGKAANTVSSAKPKKMGKTSHAHVRIQVGEASPRESMSLSSTPEKKSLSPLANASSGSDVSKAVEGKSVGEAPTSQSHRQKR